MTKFKIKNIIFFTRLEKCIVVGDLISGEIITGMYIHDGSVKLKIVSIEETDGKVGGKWISNIGLSIASPIESKERLEKLIGAIVDIGENGS